MHDYTLPTKPDGTCLVAEITIDGSPSIEFKLLEEYPSIEDIWKKGYKRMRAHPDKKLRARFQTCFEDSCLGTYPHITFVDHTIAACTRHFREEVAHEYIFQHGSAIHGTWGMSVNMPIDYLFLNLSRLHTRFVTYHRGVLLLAYENYTETLPRTLFHFTHNKCERVTLPYIKGLEVDCRAYLEYA